MCDLCKGSKQCMIEMFLLTVGYGTQVQLDRCSFHDCVNHDDFRNKRYLVMAPPVGEVKQTSVLFGWKY